MLTGLQHLRRQCDIRLSIEGGIYRGTVRSMLLFGSDIWSLRVEDMQKLLALKYRYYLGIDKMRQGNFE